MKKIGNSLFRAQARSQTRQIGGLARSRWGRASLGVVLAVMSYAVFALGNDAVLDPPVDSATSQALAMQRNGDHAAPPVVMTGDLASAAYNRYMKSFDNPIPQFFGSSLKNGSSASNSGLGGE